MNSNRDIAIVVGVLYILAAVTAIVGFALYQPILSDPDYIVKSSANETQVIWGAFNELILAFSVIGISVMMYPIINKENEIIAIGYISFRLLEAMLIIMNIHNWTFLLGPNLALGPSTLMMSYFLYDSKLVPRFIAVLGFVGGSLILACALLVMFGVFLQVSIWGALLAVPVFAYEMSLALWLIVKGFNSSLVYSSLV